MDTSKRYTPKQFAALVNVSVRTLQRWDKLGILVAGRTLTGRRVYTETHLRKATEMKGQDR